MKMRIEVRMQTTLPPDIDPQEFCEGFDRKALSDLGDVEILPKGKKGVLLVGFVDSIYQKQKLRILLNGIKPFALPIPNKKLIAQLSKYPAPKDPKWFMHRKGKKIEETWTEVG